MTKETYKRLRAYMEEFENAADRPILDNPEYDNEDKIYELSNVIEAACRLSMVVEDTLMSEKWHKEELDEIYGGYCIDNP